MRSACVMPDMSDIGAAAPGGVVPPTARGAVEGVKARGAVEGVRAADGGTSLFWTGDSAVLAGGGGAALSPFAFGGGFESGVSSGARRTT